MGTVQSVPQTTDQQAAGNFESCLEMCNCSSDYPKHQRYKRTAAGDDCMSDESRTQMSQMFYAHILSKDACASDFSVEAAIQEPGMSGWSKDELQRLDLAVFDVAKKFRIKPPGYAAVQSMRQLRDAAQPPGGGVGASERTRAADGRDWCSECGYGMLFWAEVGRELPRQLSPDLRPEQHAVPAFGAPVSAVGRSGPLRGAHAPPRRLGRVAQLPHTLNGSIAWRLDAKFFGDIKYCEVQSL
mmetsp:Transcript_57481/g.151337  ORF Transcript_57481/g.151337 Transcript_57481/m.151337 type:complete len:242 (+) Transcript_57481:47-772(+)